MTHAADPVLPAEEGVRVLIPSGMIGFGYDHDLFWEALRRTKPHAIAADAGSSDPGPHYLGAGESLYPRENVKRDLTPIVLAALQDDRLIAVITSAGGAGGNQHLEWTSSIVREIVRENGGRIPVATVPAEVSADWVRAKNLEGSVHPLGHDHPISDPLLDDTPTIVAQMGWEQIVAGLEAGARIVVAGRACDETAAAAVPIWLGKPVSHSLLMGKVVECGSDCLDVTMGEGGDLPVLGTVYNDGFRIEPAIRAGATGATIQSVCKHMFYEERDPNQILVPGGTEDFSNCTFEQVDDYAVFVRGGAFVEDATYRLKLEGSTRAGFRAASLVATRSPEMIQQIDDILAMADKATAKTFAEFVGSYATYYRVYGRDGVLGAIEPMRDASLHEVAILVEVVAEDQRVADAVCSSLVTTSLMHMPYPGYRSGSSGNIAIPFSPELISRGQMYRWGIYHTVEVDRDEVATMFPVNFVVEGGATDAEPL